MTSLYWFSSFNKYIFNLFNNDISNFEMKALCSDDIVRSEFWPTNNRRYEPETDSSCLTKDNQN